MKIVIVKEHNVIRMLEGDGLIDANELALRSRFNSGQLEYFELNIPENYGCSFDAYIAALNRKPDLLYSSKLIKQIV